MDLKPFTSNQPKLSNKVQISNEKKSEVQLSKKFTYQIQWKETPHPHRNHNGGQTTLAETSLPSQDPFPATGGPKEGHPHHPLHGEAGWCG